MTLVTRPPRYEPEGHGFSTVFLPPSAPVPDQDRGSASPADDGDHHPNVPQLGAAPDVHGEPAERHTDDDGAQRQAAYQACRHAASPRGRNTISVTPPGRGPWWPAARRCARLFPCQSSQETSLSHRCAENRGSHLCRGLQGGAVGLQRLLTALRGHAGGVLTRPTLCRSSHSPISFLAPGL
jgi:hypothetical protein